MPSPYDKFSKDELIKMLTDYDTVIVWDTDCLKCANQWDSLYNTEAALNQINDILDSIPAELRNTHLSHISSLVEPFVWSKQ